LNRVLSVTSFCTAFKLHPSIVDTLFAVLLKKQFQCRPKHLLWTLHYLKSHNTCESEIALLLKTNRKTLRDKVSEVLSCLLQALPQV
jgi:hypothetical protein